MPESAFAAAEEEAKKRQLEGWVFTLQMPSYLSIMVHADNEALREEFYVAFVTRASDQGPMAGDYDNTSVIEEILALRHEMAQLLSFPNYAEKSLATKMADSCEQVTDFLEQLAIQSKPQAEEELESLRHFAKQHDNKATLAPWDIAYYSEKQSSIYLNCLKKN